jgi:hypothetical protein
VKITSEAGNDVVRLDSLEARAEPVALLSACCDLVVRTPLKRKGVIICPVRPVPRNISKNPALLAALKMSVAEAVEKHASVPANLFYLAPFGAGFEEGVLHLEAISMVEFDLLVRAKKLAELSDASRTDLQERLKHHFTRQG